MKGKRKQLQGRKKKRNKINRTKCHQEEKWFRFPISGIETQKICQEILLLCRYITFRSRKK
jgi:hypothetical protein